LKLGSPVYGDARPGDGAKPMSCPEGAGGSGDPPAIDLSAAELRIRSPRFAQDHGRTVQCASVMRLELGNVQERKPVKPEVILLSLWACPNLSDFRRASRAMTKYLAVT
jgi:hypothetical protein